MNIGVYIRPWNNKFYLRLAKCTFPNSEILLVSEFKKYGDIWLGQALYNYDNIKQVFNPDEMLDIYLRCRFLRKLPIEKALLLIKRMSSFIEQLFESYDFNGFIGHLVDNYTLDIIERICRRREIKYISLVGHFFNGYCRISSRGELNYIREHVDNEEINNVLETVLHEGYVPCFDYNKKKTYWQGIQNYYKEKARLYYYSIRKYLESDKFNYHYNTSRGITIKDVLNIRDNLFFKKIENIDFSNKTVYLPLHYTPESTVDYWCEDPIYALYENSIIELILKSSKNISFVVKEHPAMYMKRDINFYNNLLKNKNVQIIHPYENSNLLLREVRNVFVYTGSVGVEALLRGKNVFTVTPNYYSQIHNNCIIKKYLSVDDIKRKQLECNNYKFINDLLKGLIPANFVNNKMIMESNIDDISYYLSSYFNN